VNGVDRLDVVLGRLGVNDEDVKLVLNVFTSYEVMITRCQAKDPTSSTQEDERAT
jgi:hypothetical protein